MGTKKVKNPKAMKREQANKKTETKVELENALKSDHKKAAVLDSAVVTGVLASQVHNKDVKVEQFSLSLHGRVLVNDTTLELNYGRRYGLIGLNGSGKSTILSALRAREVPIPDWIDIWHLDREAEPSDSTAIDSVIAVIKDEMERLEALAMEAVMIDPDSPVLQTINDRLDKMEPETFESRACELLHGLGFTETMMKKMTKDMSGGWRMRVALAQALFVQPLLLLLDEPTNHLDLSACVWLERHLATYPHCLVVISHSQDFLNGVCNEMIHLTIDGEFVPYGGNYDVFVQTRREAEINQQKHYEKEQADIKHLQDFIRSCGTYANLRKQADSKQKVIDKMVQSGLTKKPVADPSYRFKFPDCERLCPPVLAFQDVAFSYGPATDTLYKHLEFGVDCDSRIALVGPNGAGKSTLIKLMMQELEPTEGNVARNAKLRIARYNQHSHEQLDLTKSALVFFEAMYPDGILTDQGLKKMDIEMWRQYLGRFGITSDAQTRAMGQLSGGYKSRLIFALMSLRNPHMLLLDEPTNHLDMECIDSLAEAIKQFKGGMVLVSHDFRLIDQVAEEIWVCEHKKVEKCVGGIMAYKKKLIDRLDRDERSRARMMRATN